MLTVDWWNEVVGVNGDSIFFFLVFYCGIPPPACCDVGGCLSHRASDSLISRGSVNIPALCKFQLLKHRRKEEIKEKDKV